MKFKYKFANETLEIEVNDEWGNTLIELDRLEYNNKHKETRRHSSLECMDYEGEFFADEIDIPLLLERKETAALLRYAVKQLKHKQRDLIYALYLADKPLSQSEYASHLGIEEESVKQSAWRARSALKKIIKLK